MAHVSNEGDTLHVESEEEDEIDIVGIQNQDIQMHNSSEEFSNIADNILSQNECLTASLVKHDGEDFGSQETGSENAVEEISNDENTLVGVKREDNETNKEDTVDMSLELPTCGEQVTKEHETGLQKTVNNNNEEDVESSCYSADTSASSSRISSRRNSLNESEKIANDDFAARVGMLDGISAHMSDDDDDDDDDGTRPNDPFERFFFESDYLALKDNKHYHLLLQTLVALEGQRMQAIKDLDTLCKEEKKALNDPIAFVEKLQNNEPLGLPSPQNVIKLPKIPWEVYASSFGPIDMSLPIQHHTRSSTSSIPDKATQEPQPAWNLFTSEVVDSTNTSEALFNDAVKANLSGKIPTFNQAWTIAEQTRLEKLLQVYPQEDIESKRWEKIAKALGNRTPKQVASRVQKYFIKLARAGLPIPGRIPNIPRSGSRTAKRANHYQTMGFRNSTFFPSYQPRVYMNENRNDGDDDESSVMLCDDVSNVSDDESIPDELKQTHAYRELLELKRIKRKKIQHFNQKSSDTHVGFMCDGCSADPIIGTRWHCQDCPDDTSIDFCSSCIDRGIHESRGHNQQHRFEPIMKAISFFVDGDYVGSSTGPGYNYLDPNFLPAAS